MCTYLHESLPASHRFIFTVPIFYLFYFYSCFWIFFTVFYPRLSFLFYSFLSFWRAIFYLQFVIRTVPVLIPVIISSSPWPAASICLSWVLMSLGGGFSSSLVSPLSHCMRMVVIFRTIVATYDLAIPLQTFCPWYLSLGLFLLW